MWRTLILNPDPLKQKIENGPKSVPNLMRTPKKMTHAPPVGPTKSQQKKAAQKSGKRDGAKSVSLRPEAVMLWKCICK